MLMHVLCGPFRDGTYAVGYSTPGCSVMTVVSTGMTKERAQEEAARSNEEQERRAAAIERDRQLRMRPETLRPIADYLSEIELAGEEGDG
nr:hypothetical protein [Herbaspirillum sp. ASV7]